MPTFRYHLGEEPTPLVEIDWNQQWRDMPVRARGQPVGTIASREELRTGRRFDLDGGETLLVRLPPGTFYLPEVTLDGQPLYLPAQSPQARLHRAAVVIFLVAGMYVFLGLRPLLDGAALGELPTENWVAVAAGVVFAALGALARLRSLAAVVAALGLLVLATVWGVSVTILRMPEQGISILFVVGLVVQLGLLLAIYHGVGAIRDLRRKP